MPQGHKPTKNEVKHKAKEEIEPLRQTKHKANETIRPQSNEAITQLGRTTKLQSYKARRQQGHKATR